MNRQMVLDVLNSLEVIEQNGGDDAYILVDNTEETRKKLNKVGITDGEIYSTGDENSFCILALAFNGKYADDYEDGKLIVWGPVDDKLRYRVLNGEGTASDAERLLRALEPQVGQSLRPEVRWFAEQMEAALKRNDHKGGWKECGAIYLLSRLRQETNELEGVVYFNKSEKEIISEAADVANFAMMIANNSLSHIQEVKTLPNEGQVFGNDCQNGQCDI